MGWNNDIGSKFSQYSDLITLSFPLHKATAHPVSPEVNSHTTSAGVGCRKHLIMTHTVSIYNTRGPLEPNKVELNEWYSVADHTWN